MASLRSIVKLPNCSPFQIRAEELITLYKEIKAHGYLQLDCLSSSETASDPSKEHSTRTHPKFQSEYNKVGPMHRNPEEYIRNNVPRHNNLGNSLKRKDVFDYPEQDQNDVKHPKLSRNSAPTTAVQRPAGDFNRVLDSLNLDKENAEITEPQRSPLNNLTSKPETQTVNPLRLEFENEPPSPTGFNINLKNTLDHLNEIN